MVLLLGEITSLLVIQFVQVLFLSVSICKVRIHIRSTPWLLTTSIGILAVGIVFARRYDRDVVEHVVLLL